jgi:thiol-disulfide isomerase/thioredoxin
MHSHRSRVLIALLGIVAAIAVACGDDGRSSASPSTDGEESPAATPAVLTADLVGGGEFDAASLEGTDTVLWFWAPWCTVCRAEGPDVAEAAAEFDGSVQVIGVAGRGEVPDMEQFVADTGTDALEHLIDEDGSIWSGYGVAAQPAFAFIDDSGEVELFSGALGREALAERMRALAAA